MKISFCITCMGRASHLKRTLPVNLDDNKPGKNGNGPDVEFVVLDYNSQDDLKHWLFNDPDMLRAQEHGYLVYAHYRDADYFKHSHAKNMAHRVATGDVLCNLDADNFTGPGFATYLRDLIMPDPERAIAFPNVFFNGMLTSGFYGRIAMSRKNFMALGGYKETFNYWGGEDCNLIIRALALGLEPHCIDEARYLSVIRHNNQERIENSSPENQILAMDRIESIEDKERTERVLKRIFEERSGMIACNNGAMGLGTVRKGLDAQKTVLSRMPLLLPPKLCTSGWGIYKSLHYINTLE